MKEPTTIEVKVDSTEALRLWNAGFSARQIRERIAPDASHVSVYRAVRRAVRNGGVAIRHGRKAK